MIVHVVMSNDYPHCVMASEIEAEQYAARKNAEDKELAKKEGRGRIYYKSYPFTVQGPAIGCAGPAGRNLAEVIQSYAPFTSWMIDLHEATQVEFITGSRRQAAWLNVDGVCVARVGRAVQIKVTEVPSTAPAEGMPAVSASADNSLVREPLPPSQGDCRSGTLELHPSSSVPHTTKQWNWVYRGFQIGRDSDRCWWWRSYKATPDEEHGPYSGPEDVQSAIDAHKKVGGL